MKHMLPLAINFQDVMNNNAQYNGQYNIINHIYFQ